jgi:alkyl hydroperoxide reductase subunit AhpF
MAPQRTIVVGAGPVGALAALYAARRGDEVEVYELRGGKNFDHISLFHFISTTQHSNSVAQTSYSTLNLSLNKKLITAIRSQG